MYERRGGARHQYGAALFLYVFMWLVLFIYFYHINYTILMGWCIRKIRLGVPVAILCIFINLMIDARY